MSKVSEDVMQMWQDTMIAILSYAEDDRPHIRTRARKIMKLVQDDMKTWASMDAAHTRYTTETLNEYKANPETGGSL